MKVYPTFAYACGPKTAVFIILLHTAGLTTFFETATYFLAPAIPQSALMMLASLASLILYAFIDVIAAVLLIKRLSKSKQRPLLYKKNISETVKKIYFNRKKIYNEADYRIKCNSLKSSEIVNKILGIYEKSGNKI